MPTRPKLLRNLARGLEKGWSGVSGSILEGIDEILMTLPPECPHS
jgi:hypothetical protein